VVVVRRSRLLTVAVAMTLAGAVSLLGGGLAFGGTNPPGNNGTIKIDDIPFDDHPNNEPHVGCTFQVDFYGFDEGDLFADVTFESHPPTGPVRVLRTDRVFIGEDDNSGGGSEAGLDASAEYTLDFTGIEPHPNQGFHVKLTVNAEGSQGADTKFKVFWVTGCPSGTTTTAGGGTTTTTGGGTTTTTTGGSTSSSVPSSSVGGSSSSAAGGSVGGVSSTQGAGGLAVTGANTVALLVAGLGIAGLGMATLASFARRRRA